MSTILTATGQHLDLADPQPDQVSVTDIAAALSRICRFTGHCSEHYSVAQHSVMVSLLVPPEYALAGLLHDAAEAFLGDVAKPLKNLLPDYRALEKRVEAVVFARFGLPPKLSACIKHADLVALATEKRDLMPHDAIAWDMEVAGNVQPASYFVNGISPQEARAQFLDRYWSLAPRKAPRFDCGECPHITDGCIGRCQKAQAR